MHMENTIKICDYKNNPKENFKYTDILNVWKILLIIFPSDLQIEYDIVYTFEDGFFNVLICPHIKKRRL